MAELLEKDKDKDPFVADRLLKRQRPAEAAPEVGGAGSSGSPDPGSASSPATRQTSTEAGDVEMTPGTTTGAPAEARGEATENRESNPSTSKASKEPRE